MLTPRIKLFRLLHQNYDFKFKSGQWIDLYAPLDHPKNIGGYTIISSTSETDAIDLAIRESNSHPVTQYLHQNARVGEVIKISNGQGKFFLDQSIPVTSLVFIAGGIGITPILSMIRSNPHVKKQLFYSVSHEEDILFRDELAPFSIFTATKSYSTQWSGENCRINGEMLKKYQVDLSSHFYVCGPKSMIDSIVLELKQLGVSSSQIHFEKWW